VGAKIAVIGPNADALDVLEANYHGTASHPVTPLEGLRARFGADKVLYAQGSAVAEGVPVTIPEDALSANGKAGLKGEYFATPDLTGSPRVTRQDRHVDFDWDRASPAPGLPAKGYSVRWTGQITPPSSGDYRLHLEIPRCFDCSGHDPVRLWVDGVERIADNGDGKSIATDLTFADTKPHALRIEYRHTGEDGGIGLRWIAPAQTQRDQAVAAAKRPTPWSLSSASRPAWKARRSRSRCPVSRVATAPPSNCPSLSANCSTLWPPRASRWCWC
jgi:beta-glucosidase